MDRIKLFPNYCLLSDLSQTLGPYRGDHVRRRGRFPGGGLGLSISHGSSVFRLRAGDVHKRDSSAGMGWFTIVDAVVRGVLKDQEAEGLYFDLISHIPRGEIIDLRTSLPIQHSEELCVEMCNLTRLYLVNIDLPTWFVEPDIHGPHTSKDLLRSLDSISIIRS